MSSSSVGLNRKPRGRELRVKTAIVGESEGKEDDKEETGKGGRRRSNRP